MPSTPRPVRRDILFAVDLIEQFRVKRLELGLSQLALDDRIGVASGMVAKWENGFRKPTLWNAFCWAEALGCQLKLSEYYYGQFPPQGS